MPTPHLRRLPDRGVGHEALQPAGIAEHVRQAAATSPAAAAKHAGEALQAARQAAGARAGAACGQARASERGGS
jgi:hypothetical protein